VYQKCTVKRFHLYVYMRGLLQRHCLPSIWGTAWRLVCSGCTDAPQPLLRLPKAPGQPLQPLTYLATGAGSEVHLKRCQQPCRQLCKVTPQPRCCCACCAARPDATAATAAASRRCTSCGANSWLDCCSGFGQQGVIWPYTLHVPASKHTCRTHVSAAVALHCWSNLLQAWA
jgi:hypothetical protein